jgi:hypothetical protein
LSEEFFSKVRIDIEEQKRALSTFATRTDVSQNDRALLLKAEYYLLRLSRVLYVNKIDSVIFRIRESQNAFPELHGKTMSLPLRNHYQGIIRLLATIQSESIKTMRMLRVSNKPFCWSPGRIINLHTGDRYAISQAILFVKK